MTTNKIKEELINRTLDGIKKSWDRKSDEADENCEGTVDFDVLLDEVKPALEFVYQQATADFIKMIDDEIAETPNDNDCCRGFLNNLKQKLMKKMTKFNLSEKIKTDGQDLVGDDYTILETKDVREFIRLLKEEMTIKNKEYLGELDINDAIQIIDKLAGEKLI